MKKEREEIKETEEEISEADRMALVRMEQQVSEFGLATAELEEAFAALGESFREETIGTIIRPLSTPLDWLGSDEGVRVVVTASWAVTAVLVTLSVLLILSFLFSL